MTGHEIRLRPVVTWPARVEPGGSYRISVDMETEGPPDAWPYPQEEYAVGCMLDGGTGFAVESVGDTTLVVHRFGGTYGPVTFVAHALDAPGQELCLTLITQGGVPFQTIPLNVDRPVPAASTTTIQMETDTEPRRPYFLAPYPPEREELGDARNLPPSRLLAAAASAVPFSGRAEELNRLRAWLDGDGTRAMLLHGPGGQGKTRLAAEFARASREDGWQVRAARPTGERDSRDSAGMAGPPGGQEASGLFLVVDYAETWQIEDLLDMLADLAVDGRRPLRVLFLARPSGAWWRALADRLGHAGIETTTMELGSLLGDGRLRREGFQAAAEWFSNLYGMPYDPAAFVFPRVLDTDPAFDQVLVIQMAALCAVLGEGPFTLRDRRSAVASTLLHEERTFWRRELGKGNITTRPETMVRAVCVASLVGPLRGDEGEDVLRGLGIEASAKVLRDHARCYPPAVPGTVLQPVSPDRLAEDYVALPLRDDEWVSEALRTLLGGPAGPAAVGTLVETARRWQHAAGWLNRVLREDPGPAVEAGGAVLLRLAEMPDADTAVLEAIEERLPRERRIALDIAAAVLAERLFSSRLAAAARDPARQADFYERLSERRTNVGMYEEAEDAAAKAVAIRRMRSAERGDTSTADALAEVLHLRSRNLRRLGQHEESLRQLTESVEVLRVLAAEHPRAFRAQLASSLNTQALVLAELGRRRESLVAVQEAVAIYREQPRTYQADLASALNNLSARLAGLGRPEEALGAIEEAVAIHLELDAEEPDANLPAVAANLHNYSLRLAELGRAEKGATAAAEAVRIQRRLAAAVPGAYEANLAGALANLSVRLGDLGRWEDAVAVNEEAIGGYRTLLEQRPDTYRPDLAAALNNYSVQLSELGRMGESLAAVEDAVAAYRVLAGQRPDAYDPDLAAALNNYSVRLGELGDPQAGLNAVREAVDIRRRLVESAPAAFEADLAASLANLGNRLGELRLHEESVSVGREAVMIYRRLAADHSGTFLPPLATCLDNLAIALRGVGRLNEALQVSGEAVAVYRQLTAERPAAFRASLARNLNNHSVLLGTVGRNTEAIEGSREAVDVYRALARERPRAFTGLLGNSLVNLSRTLNSAGRAAEGWVSAGEAIQLFRRSVAEQPQGDEEGLAAGLTNLSACLGGLGRHEEGSAAALEALEIYRGLTERGHRLQPEIATTLMLLSLHLHATRRFDEAVENSAAAVAVYRTLAEEDPFFLALLATALRDVAVQFLSAGRHAEALAAVDEAVRVHARLADRSELDDDEIHALQELRARLLRSYGEGEHEIGS